MYKIDRILKVSSTNRLFNYFHKFQTFEYFQKLIKNIQANHDLLWIFKNRIIWEPNMQRKHVIFEWDDQILKANNYLLYMYNSSKFPSLSNMFNILQFFNISKCPKLSETAKFHQHTYFSTKFPTCSKIPETFSKSTDEHQKPENI